MMTYEEALEKIHSFNVFGSRLGLERMRKLLELMGNPQDRMRIIHVAGTNGKGSVCRYMYSILSEAGYRVGAYFSPYIERFTERIEFAGQEISENDLARCTEIVLEHVGHMLSMGFESPTEFELVTAIGLLYFSEKDADFIILEVGLGGGGDSTNISDRPLVTAITSISYDHMAQLGNSITQIAAEKAGIIKASVPVVVCVDDDSAADVIRARAKELDAPYVDVCRAVVSSVSEELSGYGFDAEFDVLTKHCSYKGVKLSMAGHHQINNALCALHMTEILSSEGFVMPEASVLSGLKKAVQPARFEIVQSEPYLILDGAHNTAGMQALVATLQRHFYGKKILFCTGMLKDKEYEKMAELIAQLKADIVITSVPNPRRMPASELADVFEKTETYRSGNAELNVYEDYTEAVRVSEAVKHNYDVTVWAGSLYLIGAVRSMIREM